MNYSQVLEIASCTDPGMVRSHNEDSIASDPVNGLVVLADGMGGYNAGEVASGIAVSVTAMEIAHRLQNAKQIDRDEQTGAELGVLLLRDNIQKANASI